MRPRGEFIRGDGLVIPNNITNVGAEVILEATFRNANYDFWVGLCSGVYAPILDVSDLVEPAVGANGYERVQLNRNETDWPLTDVLNGERFIESRDMIWTATGGAFSQPITRMFMCFAEEGESAVFALSASLPDEVIIDEDTDISQRSFRYRVYLR